MTSASRSKGEDVARDEAAEDMSLGIARAADRHFEAWWKSKPWMLFWRRKAIARYAFNSGVQIGVHTALALYDHVTSDEQTAAHHTDQEGQNR